MTELFLSETFYKGELKMSKEADEESISFDTIASRKWHYYCKACKMELHETQVKVDELNNYYHIKVIWENRLELPKEIKCGPVIKCG